MHELATSTVLLLLLTVQTTYSRGQAQIKFLTYHDSIVHCDALSNPCDFYFKKVLIRDQDGNVLFDEEETAVTGDKDTVNFSTLDKLKDAISLNIRANRRVAISFEVWDDDPAPNDDDFERNVTNLVVPFPSIEADGSWHSEEYVLSEKGDKRATFSIQYKISSCDEHFTGSGCSSCKERWIGSDCSSCSANFAGTNCESCAANYYPKDTCNMHCPPDLTRYNCSSTGEKQCLENRTDPETGCEKCVTDHYGNDCSKVCEETQNNTCDQGGDKVCKEHFYPVEKCDTHCEPVLDNYTCNNQTGEKICEKGKTGSECDECQNSNKEGQKCDECIKYYFGEDCAIYCKPDINYYNCSETGVKICFDNTTTSDNNCGKQGEEKESMSEENKMNIPLIAGAGGGGGLLLILIVVAILLKVRRDRDKNETEVLLEEEEADLRSGPSDQEPVYSTVNKQLVQSSGATVEVYTMMNKGGQENVRGREYTPNQNDDAAYSTIQSQHVYPTTDDHDVYDHLQRQAGRSNGACSARTEEETYADVTFVRSSEVGEVVSYRNTAVIGGGVAGGEEATYIAVRGVLEDTL